MTDKSGPGWLCAELGRGGKPPPFAHQAPQLAEPSDVGAPRSGARRRRIAHRRRKPTWSRGSSSAIRVGRESVASGVHQDANAWLWLLVSLFSFRCVRGVAGPATSRTLEFAPVSVPCARVQNRARLLPSSPAPQGRWLGRGIQPPPRWPRWREPVRSVGVEIVTLRGRGRRRARPRRPHRRARAGKAAGAAARRCLRARPAAAPADAAWPATRSRRRPSGTTSRCSTRRRSARACPR